jgi:hypothetical protein
MGKEVEKRAIILVVIFVIIILGFLFLKPIFRMTGFGILGNMTLFLETSEIFINIHSPTNITYNFDKGDNYTLNLNVSSSLFTPDSWWYTLIDMKHNTVIYDSVIFTPNTTFDAVRWSNNLTVYSNDTVTESIFSLGVIFFINVSNSNPIIGNISNETFVCENSYISYFFNVTDVDEDVLTSDITPKNPFYLTFSYAVNLTMYTYEIFSGILNKEDAGGVNVGSKTYSETITMADEVSSDSKDINITVIEINNAPSITNIGAQTIWSHGDNSSFDYQVQVLDTEDGNQTSGNFNFSVIFSGQNLFNISSSGAINFTANSTYVGVHNISVCVEDLGITNLHENISLCGQDGSSIISCNNFSLTVTDENRAPIITDYFPINLSFDADGTDTLNFNISKYDPDRTLPDVYWYVDDVFEEYDSGVSLVDDFSYIFGCGISGIHSVDAVITDGELNDSIQWNVTVNPVACPSGIAPRGPGGGGSVVECIPKWACEEWPQCKNLKTGIGLVDLSLEYEFLITGRCSVFNWSDVFCGYQIRECNDLNFCRSNLTKPGLIRECYYTKDPTCEDNILNCHDGACEVLVDCGGPCETCETCSDGIKNQNEEEIDCGGSCPMCIDIELSTFRQMIWFIYLSLIVLIILLTLIIRSYIKSRKTKRRLEKEVRKRKGF